MVCSCLFPCVQNQVSLPKPPSHSVQYRVHAAAFAPQRSLCAVSSGFWLASTQSSSTAGPPRYLSLGRERPDSILACHLSFSLTSFSHSHWKNLRNPKQFCSTTSHLSCWWKLKRMSSNILQVRTDSCNHTEGNLAMPNKTTHAIQFLGIYPKTYFQ